MNPESHDLSMWRSEPPPSAVFDRILQTFGARERVVRRVSRVGLVSVGLIGLGGVALVSLLPSPAQAASARTLVVQARKGLATAPFVHLREYENGKLVTETWFAKDRWRITSTKAKGGDRIFRVVSVPTAKGAVASGPFSYQIALEAPVGKTAIKPAEAIFRIERTRAGDSVKLLFWSRRNGEILPAKDLIEGARNYRMETLAATEFPEGSLLRYSDQGVAGAQAGRGRRILVTSASAPLFRQTWVVRTGDSWPIRLLRERREESAWRVVGSADFEYPRSIPSRVFDPRTLR